MVPGIQKLCCLYIQSKLEDILHILKQEHTSCETHVSEQHQGRKTIFKQDIDENRK